MGRPRFTELTEAEQRTLVALKDGKWHRGSRSAGGDLVLGYPAARLVRLGLADRHVANPNRRTQTWYWITDEGKIVLLEEGIRLAQPVPVGTSEAARIGGPQATPTDRGEG